MFSAVECILYMSAEPDILSAKSRGGIITTAAKKAFPAQAVCVHGMYVYASVSCNPHIVTGCPLASQVTT